jgi:hypothetical protein
MLDTYPAVITDHASRLQRIIDGLHVGIPTPVLMEKPYRDFKKSLFGPKTKKAILLRNKYWEIPFKGFNFRIIEHPAFTQTLLVLQ